MATAVTLARWLRRPLADRARWVQWAVLLVLSGVFVTGLEALRLPAALLLGPMIAAILVASAEGTVRAPSGLFVAAQAVIGCMIAHSIPVSIFAEITRNAPLFLAGVVSVIAAAAGLGWLMARWRVLPGTVAIWGVSPGAATAMTLMAESYGADVRLVAVMQYLRVVCVAAVATLVARLWATGPATTGSGPEFVWFPPVAWGAFAETLIFAALCILASRRLRIQAGPLLLPLVTGLVLQRAGWLRIELPPLLLAISYAFVGWSIGLRFTRPIVLHAARALPRIVLSILALIAVCALFAAVLVFAAGIDPLTAYLATSPGGADSVAIIAASSKVDLPFVMAMQTARSIVVLFTGPRLARFVARRMGAEEKREGT